MREYNLSTLDYILNKYQLPYSENSPPLIEIPNMGRDQLPELFNELGFKTGAEVGVLAGTYSELLCKNIPGLKMYGVDPYKAYIQHPEQSELDAFYREAKQRLAPYDYHFITKTSLEAAKSIKENSLDFVYVDGAHDFDNVTTDLTVWMPKVRLGGIISGHDFMRRPAPTHHYVVQAVTAFIRANNIRPWFLIGLNAKIPGVIRDTRRSWMWVKQ